MASLVNHFPSPSFSTTLRRVYKRLQEDYGHATRDVLIKQDGLSFLGVRTTLRGNYSPKVLRQSIEKMLGHQNGAEISIIQVVGDSSNGFTPEGLALIKAAIMREVNNVNGNGRLVVLEYGYTASLHDTNWAVNDLITTIPELSHTTIGNVVHVSAKAVEEWNCEATDRVQHFVLAYDEGETTFGDDMWISDSIMSADNKDVLVCVEGGPQAFFQAASVCADRVAVIAIWSQAGCMREVTDGKSSHRFSAACVLDGLVAEFGQCVDEGCSEDIIGHRMGLSVSSYLKQLREAGTGLQAPQERLVREGLQKIIKTPQVVRHIKPHLYKSSDG